MTEALPLASAIRAAVQEWRNRRPKYEGASDVTKRLLGFWFEEDHFLLDNTKFEFWRCQREAIESVIYTYEVCRYSDLYNLIRGMNVSLQFDPNQYRWNKLAFKMATGSGKTFVMAMALVWQFLNRLYSNNGLHYSSDFLMIAPNLIVLDRLADSFEDGKVFSKFPFIPPEFSNDLDFQLIKQNEDVVHHGRCILHLTNWQQFVERQDEAPPNPVTARLGKKPVKGEEFKSGKSLFQDILRAEDIVIFNDEAHHVYTDELVWGDFLSRINDELKRRHNKEILIQLDFSATPQYPTSQTSFFPHIIYDYPLNEAIRDKIVKRPVIGIIEGAPEPFSRDFVEKNRIQIDTGIRELKEFQSFYRGVKKPVLFVMCDTVKNANKVGNYIRDLRKFKDKVLVIHTDMDGNITKSQLPELRKAAKEIDRNKFEIIVSVMMLKEGWDVRNVSCIVPLRAYTSEILVEQTLGRGLRRMFPHSPVLHEELVVIEHPRFRQLWESEIRDSGLQIDVRPARKAFQAPNKISVDNSKLKYDLEIPVVLGGLTRKLPDLSKVYIRKLPGKLFDIRTVKVPKIMYKKKELLTQKIISEEELSFDYTDKHFEYLSYMARAILSKIGFAGQFADFVPILREYIENRLFKKPVNIELPDTVKKLNDPRIRMKIRDIFVKLLTNLSKTEEDFYIPKHYKLSSTPTIHTSEKVYKAKKSVFDYLPYSSKSHLERDFMAYLDSQREVKAYSKILYRFPLRIPYYDEDGIIRYHIPDFLVKTNRDYHLIETKGVGFEEMVSARLKEHAAINWCKKVTKLTKHPWSYLKIVEDEFRDYQSYDFRTLLHTIMTQGAY